MKFGVSGIEVRESGLWVQAPKKIGRNGERGKWEMVSGLLKVSSDNFLFKFQITHYPLVDLMCSQSLSMK